ncbi:hypothetical protein ACS0TY_024486 [Phlomoides rotata]
MITGDTSQTVVLRVIFMGSSLGEKCFLMEYCMHQRSLITLCSKQQECTEWSVKKLIL